MTIDGLINQLSDVVGVYTTCVWVIPVSDAKQIIHEALKKQRESKLLYLWGPTGKSILSGTETSITFEMTGKVKGASSDTTIVICDEADGNKSKTITITKMGSLQPISEGDC